MIFPYKTGVELKKFPMATATFVAICTFVHIIKWLTTYISPTARYTWSQIIGYIFYKPHTAITHVFVHSDVEHIFFNMLFFILFAAPLEIIEGKKKFWLLVLTAAIIPSYFTTTMKWLFSLLANSQDPEILLAWHNILYHVPSIGASGVVCAFSAAYLIRFSRKRLYFIITYFAVPIPKLLPIPAWFIVLVYFLLANIVSAISEGIQPVMGGDWYLCSYRRIDYRIFSGLFIGFS